MKRTDRVKEREGTQQTRFEVKGDYLMSEETPVVLGHVTKDGSIISSRKQIILIYEV